MTDAERITAIRSETDAPAGRIWTKSQQAAIDFGGRGLILCAGAGSGKTATLTEKVSRLVCDEENGVPVREMLIVTFTKAAAGELRERIGKALRKKLIENPSSKYLTRQIVDLESAEISTMSSFFLRAVKPYFSELGLSPSFRVEEESAMNVLKERIMADVTDSFFDMRDDEFTRLADCLGTAKDENGINGTLLEIAEKMIRKGIGAEQMALWAGSLEAYADGDYFASPYGKILRDETHDFARHFLTVYNLYSEKFQEDEAATVAYGEHISETLLFLKRVERCAESGTYAEMREIILGFKLPDLKSNKSKTTAAERFKDSRDYLKKALDPLKKKYAAEAETASAAARDTAVICRGAAKVLAEYFSAFEAEKKERGVVDFSDLEVYTHRIFCEKDGSPTVAAKDFAKRFKYIFIDEYQDTNKIQDEIFSALGAEMKRFMVGDVKQSIYAFRGAEPEVFTSYRKRWDELTEDNSDGCVSIFMNENFRSDSTVIDFVNLVSEYMFKDSATPFERGDRLVFSKKPDLGDCEKKTEICIFEKKRRSAGDDQSVERGDPEFEYVVNRIAHMIKSETLPDGSPIRPGDIAVLTRGTADAGKIAELLEKKGVAAADITATEFFEQSEILLVLCILNMIDNPLRDVHLAGAMKSPVFGFSMDDMIGVLDVRDKEANAPLWFCVTEYAESGKNESLRLKCKAVFDFVADFRRRVPGMSASKILGAVYDALSLYSLSPDGDGDGVRRNLTKLYEYARKFEDTSFGGLYGFILYINELMENNKNSSSEVKLDKTAVTLMNIHKSKGLEFPVCFICKCAKKFNFNDAAADVIFDPSIGLAMKLRDESGLVKCETLQRAALSDKVHLGNVYEESRILYVAMTRAVSKLVVTMTFQNIDKAVRSAEERYDFQSPYQLAKTSSYADLILPAAIGAMREGEDSYFEMKEYRHGADFDMEEDTVVAADTQDACEEAPDEEKATELARLYVRRISFKYPVEHLKNIPAKVTVSRLTPSLLDEDALLYETGLELISEVRESLRENAEDAPQAVDVPRPRFLLEKAEVLATDIGTATHVFLQFCDFEGLKERGFDSELSRLIDKKFMTEKVASLVSKKEIERFAESDLFASVLASDKVYREFRFNAALPAADFTTDTELKEKLRKSGRDIIVQGVVDLVYRDREGRMILVDYKTDRLTEREKQNRALAEKKLRARHTMQLSYYKLALEKMFGEEVYKTFVYSLALGGTVEI